MKERTDIVYMVLQHPTIPHKDKLWIVLRPELIDELTIIKFSVGCAQRVLSNIREGTPARRDARKCIDVALRYISGEATCDEMRKAWERIAKQPWHQPTNAAQEARVACGWCASCDGATIVAPRAVASAAYAAADIDKNAFYDAWSAEEAWQVEELLRLTEED